MKVKGTFRSPLNPPESVDCRNSRRLGGVYRIEMAIRSRVRCNPSAQFPSLLLLAFFVSCTGCRREFGIRETEPKYSINDPAGVPIVLVGKVIERGRPVGPFHRSRFGRLDVQLWKAGVQVENVLQGGVGRGDVDIFYFIHDVPGSARILFLLPGERDVFFLMKDGDKLRTICEAARNCCAETVTTGAHPDSGKASGLPINQAITDILLTRGIGVNDKQLMEAVAKQGNSPRFGEEATVSSLLRLVKTESPAVREAACESLRRWKHPCEEEIAGNAKTPSVDILDLTHPYALRDFRWGDRFQTTVTGLPNQPVYRTIVDGSYANTKQVGVTDGHGRFEFERTPLSSAQGTRTELWSVGNAEASPAISYVADRLGGHGKVIVTPVWKPRDRYGMAISVLSASGGKVITYSAIQLDYETSLYYDVREVATLYQEGKAIQTATFSGGALANGVLEAPTIAMNDYFTQTNEYAVAFFKSPEFHNPLGFAKGSCYGTSGDCQIVPLGGSRRIPNPEIFVGSTGADQTAVPQDPGLYLGSLGIEEKASVLDAVLTRGYATDDSYMISMIRTVAAQRQFGRDLLVSRMRQLAAHETPKVRQAACVVLRNLGQSCPKSERTAKGAEPRQSRELSTKPIVPSVPPVNPDPLRFAAIPKYLVYGHFMMMIRLMDEKARAKAGANPYDFTWPFCTGKLRPPELDALRSEANSLTHGLAKLDEKAQAVVAGFRRRASLALQRKGPMPPAPPEIYRLRALRTALAVHAMVSLQTKLGPQGTVGMEAFLAYEFTPHGGMEVLAHPVGHQ